jgi:hypothetical protein
MSGGILIMTVDMVTIDAFTRGYLEAALWTEDPDPRSGEWAESDSWNIAAIDPVSLTRAIEDCRNFQNDNEALLDQVADECGATSAQCGHDFWLTRNGHGCGFWDRGYGALGDLLSKASKPYGEAYINASAKCADCGADVWSGSECWRTEAEHTADEDGECDHDVDPDTVVIFVE